MTENEFMGWVIDTAVRFGWRVWHVGTPMRPVGRQRWVPEERGRGLSDLVMLHDDPPRLVFAELKKEGGRLSVEQREFLRLAAGVAEASGGAVGSFSFWPRDCDLIETMLRSKVLA